MCESFAEIISSQPQAHHEQKGYKNTKPTLIPKIKVHIRSSGTCIRMYLSLEVHTKELFAKGGSHQKTDEDT